MENKWIKLLKKKQALKGQQIVIPYDATSIKICFGSDTHILLPSTGIAGQQVTAEINEEFLFVTCGRDARMGWQKVFGLESITHIVFDKR